MTTQPMRLPAALLALIVPTAAAAHPGVGPHVHPHGAESDGGLGFIVAAALALLVLAGALAWRKARR